MKANAGDVTLESAFVRLSSAWVFPRCTHRMQTTATPVFHGRASIMKSTWVVYWSKSAAVIVALSPEKQHVGL